MRQAYPLHTRELAKGDLLFAKGDLLESTVDRGLGGMLGRDGVCCGSFYGAQLTWAVCRILVQFASVSLKYPLQLL